MDFIIGLTKVHEKDCIYIIMYHLNKYAHFVEISTNYQAPQISEVFFEEIFKLHVLLSNIDSDRDK